MKQVMNEINYEKNSSIHNNYLNLNYSSRVKTIRSPNRFIKIAKTFGNESNHIKLKEMKSKETVEKTDLNEGNEWREKKLMGI